MKKLTQWPESTRTHITWCRTIILFTLCLQRNVRKKKKDIDQRKKFHILQKRADFFPVFLYWLHMGFICYSNYWLIFIYISLQVHFSRRVTSDHSLVWSIQNKEHFMPEASDGFNIPVCSARRVPSWAHWSLALLSIPCRIWGEIRIIRKF